MTLQLVRTKTNYPAWMDRMLFSESKDGTRRFFREEHNVRTILECDERWCDVLAFNDFTLRVDFRGDPPWDDPHEPSWTDLDDVRLKGWLRAEYELSFDLGMVSRGVQLAAETRRYHPVREWLESLTWDQEPRLSHWLHRIAGAPDDEYTRQCGRWWMIGAVARIYKPGCKVDHMLILEGEQGIRKSTLLEHLCPTRDLFRDTPIDLKNKDSFTALRGKWILEWAELDSLTRAEARSVKAYVSSQVDSYRPPYARRDLDAPRQCVFAGTTNESAYLTDPTGNRRFWPVRCSVVDIAELDSQRDQLWAESVAMFKQGATWWPDTLEADATTRAAQDERVREDPWVEVVRAWLPSRLENELTVSFILENACGCPKEKMGVSDSTRVGRIMKQLGWVSGRRSGGNRDRFWGRSGR